MVNKVNKMWLEKWLCKWHYLQNFLLSLHIIPGFLFAWYSDSVYEDQNVMFLTCVMTLADILVKKLCIFCDTFDSVFHVYTVLWETLERNGLLWSLVQRLLAMVSMLAIGVVTYHHHGMIWRRPFHVRIFNPFFALYVKKSRLLRLPYCLYGLVCYIPQLS